MSTHKPLQPPNLPPLPNSHLSTTYNMNTTDPNLAANVVWAQAAGQGLAAAQYSQGNLVYASSRQGAARMFAMAAEQGVWMEFVA